MHAGLMLRRLSSGSFLGCHVEEVTAHRGLWQQSAPNEDFPATCATFGVFGQATAAVSTIKRAHILPEPTYAPQAPSTEKLARGTSNCADCATEKPDGPGVPITPTSPSVKPKLSYG
jgi:hypothetical protein